MISRRSMLLASVLSTTMASVTVAACSDDGPGGQNGADADAAADLDGTAPPGDDLDGTAPPGDGASTVGDAEASTDGSSVVDGASGDAGTGSLVPTDGGAYFVAAIDGQPTSLMNTVSAARSPGGFTTARGNAGTTLPLRDLEIRFPSKVGTAACDGTVLSLAGLVYRSSDRGAFMTSDGGTSCAFNVTAVSEAAGQRVKGTFEGKLTSTTGEIVNITGGAFDLPTIN